MDVHHVIAEAGLKPVSRIVYDDSGSRSVESIKYYVFVIGNVRDGYGIGR